MDDLLSSSDRDNTAAADRFGEHAGHNFADAETAADIAAASSGTPPPARVAAPQADSPAIGQTSTQPFPPFAPEHATSRQQPSGASTPPAPAVQGNRPHRPSSTAPANTPDPWLDVDMEVRLHFGGREMLLSEALEIGPGTVIELDRHVDDPVDLLVGDRVVARGEVVVLGGNFALQISEVLAPQPRLESVRCLL